MSKQKASRKGGRAVMAEYQLLEYYMISVMRQQVGYFFSQTLFRIVSYNGTGHHCDGTAHSNGVT